MLFFPSKFTVKQFIKPVKFYARKGLVGITGNIYTGLHEFNDMAFLLHFLRADDVFYDIGANVGSYTLLASGVCKSKSVTVEPVGSTFAILKANIGLNQLEQQVSLINAAAGAIPGTVTFTSDKDATNHAVAANETGVSGTINVPVITIDSLAEKGAPALIKIDVEGYETEALKGMHYTLSQPSLKAIIIELNGSGDRYGFDEKKIHELLLFHNFKPFTYDPFNRALLTVTVLGDYNTIYCRDMDFINQRVKNAAKIEIMGESI